MKKWIALLLAVMLTLSLAACAEEEEPASNRREKRSKAEITEEATEEITEEVTEEATEEVTEEVTEPEENPIIGIVDGQNYQNVALGIGCAFDTSWEIATPEEVAELMGFAADVIDMEDQIEKLGTYCDLYAVSYSGANVNLTIQKENLVSLTVSDEELMESISATIVEPFESIGMTDIETEISTVKFVGRRCYVLNITGTLQGYPFCEKVVLYRQNGYMASITVAAGDFDVCDEAFEMFYSLD